MTQARTMFAIVAAIVILEGAQATDALAQQARPCNSSIPSTAAITNVRVPVLPA